MKLTIARTVCLCQNAIARFQHRVPTCLFGGMSSIMASSNILAASTIYLRNASHATVNPSLYQFSTSSIQGRLIAWRTGGSVPGCVVRARRLAEISALLCRTTDAAQIICGVDQADVGKCLREVSKLAPEAGMVFLCKKPEVVAQRQEALEKGFGIARAADHGVGVGEPETANEKGPFLASKSVFGFPDTIAQHKPVFQEFALDSFDSATKAIILRRQESNFRDQQERSVKRCPVIMLNEGVPALVIAPHQDLLMDLLPKCAPCLDWSTETALLHGLYRPVKCDPGHHL